MNKDLKVIAFDVFNTVYDLAAVPREEIKAYVDHIQKPAWEKLRLPKRWRKLPAFPDAAEGIARLRTQFTVVTLSNGPADVLVDLAKHNGIEWDAIVPIQLNRLYKPRLAAYMVAADMLDIAPRRIMMVTANKTFGDLEGAKTLGMTPMLIRDEEGGPATIIQLAEELGC